MRISEVLFAETSGGFYYDDQAAIRAGAVADGELYAGEAVTPGFAAVRSPAAALGIAIRLEDGTVVWGDAVSVQYAGVAGRDRAFAPRAYLTVMRDCWAPLMIGADVRSFRAADRLGQQHLRKLGIAHTALGYGVSQALLAAAAHASSCTMAEVLCSEYGLDVIARPVPVYAQSGDRRRENADKMILRRVDVLPHGLFNNRDKVGPRGERFLEYVGWLAQRIKRRGGEDYAPALHFDVYGVLGREFGQSPERIAEFLARVEAAAQPFHVRVESPIDLGDRESQIAGLAALRAVLEERASTVEIVADEWCNSLNDIRAFAEAGAGHFLQIKVPDLGSVANAVEAVLTCHQLGMATFLGGSSSETDVSARASVHIALATRPAYQLAKPGMGVDEAVMLVRNEQARALVELRGGRSGFRGPAEVGDDKNANSLRRDQEWQLR